MTFFIFGAYFLTQSMFSNSEHNKIINLLYLNQNSSISTTLSDFNEKLKKKIILLKTLYTRFFRPNELFYIT